MKPILLVSAGIAMITVGNNWNLYKAFYKLILGVSSKRIVQKRRTIKNIVYTLDDKENECVDIVIPRNRLRDNLYPLLCGSILVGYAGIKIWQRHEVKFARDLLIIVSPSLFIKLLECLGHELVHFFSK